MAFTRSAEIGAKTAWVWAALFIWVSLGQAPAANALKAVPYVVGHKLAAAQKILQQEKIRFEATAEATFFPGEHLKVFRQYPGPGSPPGGWNGVVRIWYYDKNLATKSEKEKINAGPVRSRKTGLISVPLLRGLSLSQALETISKAGLISDIAGSVPTADRKLMLKVADQDPPAGSLVRPRSRVSVYLFKFREYKTPRQIQKEMKKREIKRKEGSSAGQD